MKKLVLLFTVLCTFSMFMASGSPATAETIGYWRFEEGAAGTHPAGTVDEIIDSSSYGNHGTAQPHALGETGNMVDLTYSSDVPGSTINPGELSNDLSMNFGPWGWKGRCILVDDDDSLDLTTAITLEAFIKWTGESQEGSNGIITKWGGGGASYFMRLDASGKPQFYLSGSAGTGALTANTAVSANVWTHLAATWSTSDNTMRLYIDGNQVGSTGYSGTINVGTTSVEIGRLAESNPFTGNMDEVRISNAALSPSEFLIAVPEPSMLTLLAAGLGLAFCLRRRNG